MSQMNHPAVIGSRYDIVYLFDVTDGNPNGDPDAGNLPRIDPETNHGLVTDVCLKRKVRNYVALKHAGVPPHDIFVKEGAVLNNTIEQPYVKSDRVRAALSAWDNWKANKKANPQPDRSHEDIARDWLCENFFDIRAFGAVLSTGEEKEVEGLKLKSKVKMTAGQVRGPVQFTIARSVHPICCQEFSLTRCAVTNEKDMEKERTMGRKFTVSYGLYRTHIFINPLLADPARHGTGFSDADLALVKEALNNMFDQDRSAARGLMAPVACFAFKHANPLGNARADQLFSRVTCTAKGDIADSQPDASSKRPPRAKTDFVIACAAEADLPTGVSLERWV